MSHISAESPSNGGVFCRQIVMGTFGGMSFLYFFVAWFGILGMKRFPKQEEEEDEGEEKMTPRQMKPVPMRAMVLA